MARILVYTMKSIIFNAWSMRGSNPQMRIFMFGLILAAIVRKKITCAKSMLQVNISGYA